MQKDDLIYRQDAIDIVEFECGEWSGLARTIVEAFEQLPSAEPERLTDDDFETIRIHLNAQKEKLCNQHRWKEAEEYQRIIDRFMAFASAEPERKKGKWIRESLVTDYPYKCSACKKYSRAMYDFCPNCGADMRGEQDDKG